MRLSLIKFKLGVVIDLHLDSDLSLNVTRTYLSMKFCDVTLAGGLDDKPKSMGPEIPPTSSPSTLYKKW